MLHPTSINIISFVISNSELVNKSVGILVISSVGISFLIKNFYLLKLSM